MTRHPRWPTTTVDAQDGAQRPGLKTLGYEGTPHEWGWADLSADRPGDSSGVGS